MNENLSADIIKVRIGLNIYGRPIYRVISGSEFIKYAKHKKILKLTKFFVTQPQ